MTVIKSLRGYLNTTVYNVHQTSKKEIRCAVRSSSRSGAEHFFFFSLLEEEEEEEGKARKTRMKREPEKK